jgi:hypothetical protein
VPAPVDVGEIVLGLGEADLACLVTEGDEGILCGRVPGCVAEGAATVVGDGGEGTKMVCLAADGGARIDR